MANGLLKQEIFVKHQGDMYLIYALHDLFNQKFAVVMANSMYVDATMNLPLSQTQDMFIELVTDELQEPFMDWFDTLEMAIEQHFLYFS